MNWFSPQNWWAGALVDGDGSPSESAINSTVNNAEPGDVGEMIGQLQAEQAEAEGSGDAEAAELIEYVWWGFRG